ncbi:hypothetical protein JNN96_31335 [Mycobacterium sp. DSM 3803]|nr:hypothetical protein [Mycobacterium sp. DSM 3803]
MRLLCVVLASLVVLTGCTSAIAGTPTAAPVDDEWRNAVRGAVGGLGTALGPVGDAMGNNDYQALRPACEALGSYLDTMQRAVLPGPDVNVNAALQDGIDEFHGVATQCAALTPASTPADLQRLSKSIDRAHKRIDDALKLLGIEIPKP